MILPTLADIISWMNKYIKKKEKNKKVSKMKSVIKYGKNTFTIDIPEDENEDDEIIDEEVDNE